MPRAETAAQIARFSSRYSPEIAAQLSRARRELRAEFPRGFELVFDNYNALVFAISPSESAADAFVSVAGYPRWVTLFFLHGAQLDDPLGLLEGTGKQVRSIRLATGKQVSSPAVRALLKQARTAHAAALKAAPKLSTTVKAALEKRRARRPSPAKKQPAKAAKHKRPRPAARDGFATKKRAAATVAKKATVRSAAAR
jgi:hypothetical protein